MNNNQLHGDPFNQFAGTLSGTSITATQAVGTFTNVYITDIMASSDKANSLLVIKSGATIIYEAQLLETAAGISTFDQQFNTPLKGTKGTVITATVSGATGTATVAINGYLLADA
jgi:hypothetical protein